MKSINERIRELEKGPVNKRMNMSKAEWATWQDGYWCALHNLRQDLLAEVKRLEKDIQKTEFMGKALLKAQISKLKEIIGDDKT